MSWGLCHSVVWAVWAQLMSLDATVSKKHMPSDDVPPLSKEDHHLPFMSDEDRAAAMAERGL